MSVVVCSNKGYHNIWVCLCCLPVCLFICWTEGDAACQCRVLGCQERKPGLASAVVEQRPSGCRL